MLRENKFVSNKNQNQFCMNEEENGLIDLSTLMTPEPANEPALNIEIEGQEGTEKPVVETQTTEEEETPPTVVTTTEPIVDPIPEVKPTAGVTKDILKRILGEGYIISVPTADGDVDKTLDELDLTPEETANLIADYFEEEKKTILQNKVSTEGMSEIVQTILQIDQAGGDITRVIKAQEAYINPLDKLDLLTSNGQKEALRLAYKAENKLADDEIELLIQGFEANNTLEDKAVAVEAALRAQVKAFQEAELQKAQEQAEKKKANIKLYKKAAKDHLDLIKVKESVKNKAVESLVTETTKGRYKIDEEFEKALQDPKKAAKLAVFLLDENEYNTIVSQDKVVEEKLKEGKKLNLRRATDTEKRTEAPTKSGEVDLGGLFQ